MNKEDSYSFDFEPMTITQAMNVLHNRLHLATTPEERADVRDDMGVVVGTGSPFVNEERDDRDLPGVLCALLRRADAKTILHDLPCLIEHLRAAWPPAEEATDLWIHEAWQAAGMWMLQESILPGLSAAEFDHLEAAIAEVKPSMLYMFRVLRARCMEKASALTT